MHVSRFKKEKRSKEISKRVWEPFYSILIESLKSDNQNIRLMEKNKAVTILLNELIELHMKLGWLNYDNETLDIISKILQGDTSISTDKIKEVRVKSLIKYAQEGIEELKETTVDYISDYADMKPTINLIHKLEDELEDIEEKRNSNLDVSYEEVEKIIAEIVEERKRLKSEGETMKWKGKSTFYKHYFSTQIPLIAVLSYLTHFCQKIDFVRAILSWAVVTLLIYTLFDKCYRKYPKFAKELEE